MDHIKLNDLLTGNRLRKRKANGLVDHNITYYPDKKRVNQKISLGDNCLRKRSKIDRNTPYEFESEVQDEVQVFRRILRPRKKAETGTAEIPHESVKVPENRDDLQTARKTLEQKCETENTHSTDDSTDGGTDDSMDDSDTDTITTDSSIENVKTFEDKDNLEEIIDQSTKTLIPVGNLVWGKFGKTKWWPAIVIHGEMVKQKTKKNYVWLYWLVDRKITQVKLADVVNFPKIVHKYIKEPIHLAMRKSLQRAIKIMEDRQPDHDGERTAINLEEGQYQVDNVLTFVEQNKHLANPNEEERQQNHDNERMAINLEEGQYNVDNVLTFVEQNKHLANPSEDTPLPLYISEDLNIYSKHDEDKPIEHEDKPSRRAKKNYKKFDIEQNCLGCTAFNTRLHQHPLFEGFLCDDCKVQMMKNIYAVDSDDCSLVCGICGDLGLLAVCGSKDCGRAYCFECIDNLVSKEVGKQIEKDSDWMCFLCKDYEEETHGKIKPRIKRDETIEKDSDWMCFLCKDYEEETHGKIKPRFKRDETVIQFFNDVPMCNDLSYLTGAGKRKIRVLSLFDGIGTGKTVLEELGLDIEVYYASEIDQDAIEVTRHNYKDEVTQLGDTWELNSKTLQEICPIDLVLAGPPCNDLSIVNPRRKGFEGSGILVLKFQLILREIQLLSAGTTHIFWMMENTGSMLTEYKQAINHSLAMKPALWDAKYFSGQRRLRNFWGNIPGLYSTPDVLMQLERDKTNLDDVLTPGYNRKAQVECTRTITTMANSLTITNGKQDKLVHMDGEEDDLWVEEIERLFGFKTGYTDTGTLSDGKRRKLLGKAWSVPVVKQILAPLRKYFKLKDMQDSSCNVMEKMRENMEKTCVLE